MHSYSYDPAGNRTQVLSTGPTTATYSTGTNNRVTSDGTWTYTYDAAGNQTQKVTGTGASQVEWQYGYDTLNRLTNATETVGTTLTAEVTYVYDVQGNRVQDSRLDFGWWLDSDPARLR